MNRKVYKAQSKLKPLRKILKDKHLLEHTEKEKKYKKIAYKTLAQKFPFCAL